MILYFGFMFQQTNLISQYILLYNNYNNNTIDISTYEKYEKYTILLYLHDNLHKVFK